MIYSLTPLNNLFTYPNRACLGGTARGPPPPPPTGHYGDERRGKGEGKDEEEKEEDEEEDEEEEVEEEEEEEEESPRYVLVHGSTGAKLCRTSKLCRTFTLGNLRTHCARAHTQACTLLSPDLRRRRRRQCCGEPCGRRVVGVECHHE